MKSLEQRIFATRHFGDQAVRIPFSFLSELIEDVRFSEVVDMFLLNGRVECTLLLAIARLVICYKDVVKMSVVCYNA